MQNWDPKDNHGPIGDDVLSETLANIIGPVLQQEASRNEIDDEAEERASSMKIEGPSWMI